MKIKRSELIHLANKYIGNDSLEAQNQIMLKIATARCARVSYTVVGEEGKEPNYENDIKLHDRLIDSNHWSPLEHCARVMSESEYKKNKYSRNFEGFVQYRAMVEGRGY
jgi:thymidylate synthase ThyX